MDGEEESTEEGTEARGGWQATYPSNEAERGDLTMGTRDYEDDDQGLPEYDTSNMAAQQQELARLIGLIQQDPDAFMAGIGDGSIPINVPLTPDQTTILAQYVGVERAAQLKHVLDQMF